MEKIFSLEIHAFDKSLFKGRASSLIVPAEYGYLGVLANHLPLFAHLVKGRIIVRDDSGRTHNFDSGTEGFIEVFNNKATIILY